MASPKGRASCRIQISDRGYITASPPTRFSFSGERKTKKRKSCKGDAPLTPAVSSDTTTAWGSSGEGSVQAAQRGQVGVQVIKRSAANTFFGFPLRGRLNERLSPEHGNFLRCVRCLCRLPLPACPFPGGLGGRSRIEFIVSPLPRRRHNESHFAAQPPERSFFF